MTNEQVLTVSTKLDAAAVSLACGFIWKNSPEGADYWRAQYNHLHALADQIAANVKGYTK